MKFSFNTIEIFDTFQDASTWIEGYLREFQEQEELTLEQCSINLINGKFRAGVAFSNAQLEMFHERA